MKCFWCTQETPDRKDKFEMCKSCYTKTLDGFTLIESTKKKTECKVNDEYLTGRFVVVDRNVIREIVINNKSDVPYTSIDTNGKKHKGIIRTTFLQRHAMKKVFTLDVLQEKRALIPENLFSQFVQNEIRRTRYVKK